KPVANDRSGMQGSCDFRQALVSVPCRAAGRARTHRLPVSPWQARIAESRTRVRGPVSPVEPHLGGVPPEGSRHLLEVGYVWTAIRAMTIFGNAHGTSPNIFAATKSR